MFIFHTKASLELLREERAEKQRKLRENAQRKLEEEGKAEKNEREQAKEQDSATTTTLPFVTLETDKELGVLY